MALEFTEILTLPIYQKDNHEIVEMRVSRDSLYRYYVRLGKSYYDTLDEVWRPTKDGATIPLNIETGQALLKALTALISIAESRGIIDAGFKESVNFRVQ